MYLRPVGFDPTSGGIQGAGDGDGNGVGSHIHSADQWWPPTTGQFGDQQVVWDPVPVQDVVVQEIIPAGFPAPIAVCGGQRLNVSGDGSITLAITDGAVVRCDWYSIPA